MPNAIVQGPISATLKNSSGGTETVTASFPLDTQDGNALVCVCFAFFFATSLGGNGSTISGSITPPSLAGITWLHADSSSFEEVAHAVGFSESPTLKIAAIYYALNAPKVNAGTLTSVSISGSSSVSGIQATAGVVLVEISGEAASGQLDSVSQQSASNNETGGGGSGTSTRIDAGNLTLADTDFVIVAALSNSSRAMAAGSGYTFFGNIGALADGALQYQLNAPAGTLATALSVGSVSPDWCCVAASFRPPIPIPPSTPCVPSLTEGVFISDRSLYIGPATALFANPIGSARMQAYESTNEGRTSIVIDFDSGAGLYSRDFETTFTWPLGLHLNLDVWQTNLIPQPEGIFGRVGDWDDGGSPGAKFIQGIIVEANSFNVAKTFQLQSADDLTYHTLKECPATFNQQSTKAFSCTPFVAHSARWISFDGVEWQVFDARLVFEPFPESTLNWETEMTSLGLVGYGHVREMNIPHISTADLTLVLTFDSWPTITLTIPNSGGVQAKTKVTLPANKFKLIGFRVYSTSVFRIFAPDLELKLKYWGSTGSYEILKPFGGPSSPGALV